MSNQRTSGMETWLRSQLRKRPPVNLARPLPEVITKRERRSWEIMYDTFKFHGESIPIVISDDWEYDNVFVRTLFSHHQISIALPPEENSEGVIAQIHIKVPKKKGVRFLDAFHFTWNRKGSDLYEGVVSFNWEKGCRKHKQLSDMIIGKNVPRGGRVTVIGEEKIVTQPSFSIAKFVP